MNMARTLLASTENIQNKDALWAAAENQANCFRNILHKKACDIPHKTSYEPLVGTKPKLGHSCFLVPCHTIISRNPYAPINLHPSEKGFYFGISASSGHRTFTPSSKKIIVTRDAYLHEETNCTEMTESSIKTEAFSSELADGTSDTVIEAPRSLPNATNDKDAETMDDTVPESPVTVIYLPAGLRRSQRDTQPKPIHGHHDSTMPLALSHHMGNNGTLAPLFYLLPVNCSGQ